MKYLYEYNDFLLLNECELITEGLFSNDKKNNFFDFFKKKEKSKIEKFLDLFKRTKKKESRHIILKACVVSILAILSITYLNNFEIERIVDKTEKVIIKNNYNINYDIIVNSIKDDPSITNNINYINVQNNVIKDTSKTASKIDSTYNTLKDTIK